MLCVLRQVPQPEMGLSFFQAGIVYLVDFLLRTLLRYGVHSHELELGFSFTRLSGEEDI